MKQTAFLFTAILLLAASAGAQANSDNSLPLAPAPPEAAGAAALGAPSLFAMNAAPTLTATSGLGAEASSALGSNSTDQQVPSVYGVFQNYNWQATAGYTFFRFYVLPHVNSNMNGLNLGLVYYPGGHWYAADGEFIGAWGSVDGKGTKYVQGMGGGRARWEAPRGIEVWGHVLVGGTHFLPQTTFGGQGAFAYEVGGGVDLNLHQRRIAYRVSANMVGTRYFGTYQYSPNVSVGVVFKF
jgi:hypothetical protein